MKVLVTGATGFLGRWLCKKLIQEGHTVHVLARPSSDLTVLPKGQTVVRTGDVTDLASFSKAAEGVEVMFHLAGLVAYAEKFRSAMEEINVKGTSYAVQICRQKNIRLVYMSSVVAVGASKTKRVLNEESPYEMAACRFGYFDTKKAAEELVQKACQKGDLFSVILNPSNVYGAGDMKKASRRTHIWVARGRFPFYTEGGLSVVDVESVIEACVQAMHKGRSGERYILSGGNITIKELFQMIAECTGARPPFIKLNDLSLDMIALLGKFFQKLGGKSFLDKDIRVGRFYHWFDHTKASRELGFAPKSARQAIQNSIHWWRDHLQKP